MHETKLILIIVCICGLDFALGDGPELPTGNTALQYLTNSTGSAKKPDVSAEIKKHIKDAWLKDPILSKIEVFQALTNQLGSKRMGIVPQKRRRLRKPARTAAGMLRHMIHGQAKRGPKHSHGRKKQKGGRGFKRTKYLDISLKFAKPGREKSDYQVTVVPQRPLQQTSDSRQEQVSLVHHLPPYRFPPLSEHHQFHYKPFFPGLQPEQHHADQVQTQQTQHPQGPWEIQDEVNKLMRQSEALRETAAKFESKAKELANEAEILHHETLSTDGHMGQIVGETNAHAPVQQFETEHPVSVVQPQLCGNEQSAHVVVQAEYPVYHIPCKTPEQPVIDYHRPEPPPEGVNPYEILTSDMLNEENYRPHVQHQRHRILAKSPKKRGKKNIKGKGDRHYSFTILYSRRKSDVKTTKGRNVNQNQHYFP